MALPTFRYPLLFTAFHFIATLESAAVSICIEQIIAIGMKHIVHLNQVSA